MTTQQQIISTIHQVAGSPLSVLERTARNLTKASLLPEPGREWLPEDAATLAIAVAAARSPSEAVSAITAYRSAPLTSALFNGHAGCAPLTIGPGVPVELRESAITALAFELEGPHPNVAASKSLRVAVHRSVQFPLATLYAEFDTGTMQLDYSTGKPIDLSALIQIMVIPPKLLAAIKALFASVPVVADASNSMVLH